MTTESLLFCFSVANDFGLNSGTIRVRQEK